MFLSNNSSISSSTSSSSRNNNISCSCSSCYNNNDHQHQPALFDRPFYVCPNNNFRHHQPLLPPSASSSPPKQQSQSLTFFHFSPTFFDQNSQENDIEILEQPYHHQDIHFNHHYLNPQHQQELLVTTIQPSLFSSSTTAAAANLDSTTATLLEGGPNSALGVADEDNMITKDNVDCGGTGGSTDFNKMNKKYSTNLKMNEKKLISSSSSSKKDRHSKIVTAQGPRDRRMRLSLKVARPFFAIQDMLGFDKASKTVEWLLTNCKEEINELKRSLRISDEDDTVMTAATNKRSSCSRGGKSVVISCASDCEVISEIDVSNNSSSNNLRKEKRVRPSRKPTFHPQAKESRAKARARARERTMGKIWSKSMMPESTRNNNYLHNHNNLTMNQLATSTSPFEFETGDESGSQSQEMKSSLDVVAEAEEPISHSPSLEESIVITGNSSPPTQIFNYHHHELVKTSHTLNLNNINSFADNWDIENTNESSSFCATSVNIQLSAAGNIHDP
ncbi:hypothetical protein MKX01_024652, partial [Papaver californicum]